MNDTEPEHDTAGLIAITLGEARRLFAALTAMVTTTTGGRVLAWSRWRRRHSRPTTCSTRCHACGMAEQISQRELRNDSGRIMRALDEGHTFVVSRNGQPVGELRPLWRQRFVAAQAAVEMFRRASKLDWNSVREDIDKHVDQDIEPRG